MMGNDKKVQPARKLFGVVLIAALGLLCLTDDALSVLRKLFCLAKTVKLVRNMAQLRVAGSATPAIESLAL